MPEENFDILFQDQGTTTISSRQQAIHEFIYYLTHCFIAISAFAEKALLRRSLDKNRAQARNDGGKNNLTVAIITAAEKSKKLKQEYAPQ